MKNGTLALLGSGETSSQGRKIHDYLMACTHKVPVHVALIETPAGFQPNAHSVYQKIGEFMEKSLQNYRPQIEYVAAHRKESTPDANSSASERALLDADYIFTGPGSPTYAARNLQGTRTFDLMVESANRGATLVLSSAAAVCAGSSTMRVYEIFKAGSDLGWDDGLHLLPRLGFTIDPVIVPHWNNAEGGAGLDTTHCFVGLERFERLTAMLPADTPVLGIDEHTACILESGSASFRVMGAGGATVLNNGTITVVAAGGSFSLSLLQTPVAA